MIDIFEDVYSYASTDSNYLMLDAAWKWLPKTAIFLNAQQGFIFYLNEAEATANNKESSFPLRGHGRVAWPPDREDGRHARARLHERLLRGRLLDRRHSGAAPTRTCRSRCGRRMLSRIVVGYRHDFQNAVVASFSYNETVYASYVQQIAGRLALDLSGRYVHRNYGGQFVDPMQMATGRTDDFIQVGATLDYFVRNWIYVGVGYSLLSNSSNIPTVEYLKQQMFVRLGLTY